MAADTPWAPVQEGALAAASQNGASDPALDQVVDTIDPDDPRLTSEVLDTVNDVDVYAFPPPPPDGIYRAKLKIVQQDAIDPRTKAKVKVDWIPKTHEKQGAYVATAIEASILDPNGKFDGISVYDRWVGTFMQRGGHKVQTILSLLKKPDGTPYLTNTTRFTHKAWIETLIKALAGEPELNIETAWEYQCLKCGEEAEKKHEKRPRGVMGMQNFPVDQQKSKPGAMVYDPNMSCPVNKAHGQSRAQVRIARFLPLDYKKSA